MPNLIEAIGNKLGKLSKEQMYPQIIEPASGEMQRMLEEDCYEVLEHDPFSDEDFIKFTANLIELLGGRIEQAEPQVIIKQSSLLVDHQSDVSISLQHKNSAKYTLFNYVTITAKSNAISEQLEFGAPINRKKVPVTYGPTMISQIRIGKSPSFNSYISGSTEEIFPDGIVAYQRPIDLNTEGKHFCKKVFDIYQQREK